MDTDTRRRILVSNLPERADLMYLYVCFQDNAEVLYAAFQRGLDSRKGLVEFATHSDAEFVMKYYNGERMPNFNHKRFCLDWDVDDIDVAPGSSLQENMPPYKLLSKSCIGPDSPGKARDADTPMEQYEEQLETTYINLPRAEDQIHRGIFISCPEKFKEDKELYLRFIERTYDLKRKRFWLDWDDIDVAPGSSLQENMPLYKLLSKSCIGPDSAGTVRDADTPMEQYKEQLETTYINLPRAQDQPHQRIFSLCPEKIKEDEKELYLCFEEVNSFDRPCYVIRSIKLSELLECTCDFNRKCHLHCTTNTEQKLVIRQRAWIYADENVPHKLDGDATYLPKFMSCYPLSGSSEIIFAGGVRPATKITRPKGAMGCPFLSFRTFEPSQDVYSLNLRGETLLKIHDSRVPPGIPGSLLFEVNGVRYCFAIRPRDCQWGCLEHLTWEELTSNCSGWVALPHPFEDLSESTGGPGLDRCDSLEILACAVVGSKILISACRGPKFPIMCIDVNDKNKKWREMPSCNYGEPFPFYGRGLVLDINNHTSDKVMFCYGGQFKIYVARLKVDVVSGDVSVRSWYTSVHPAYEEEDEEYLGYSRRIGVSTFVDLGDGKVGFFLSDVNYLGTENTGGKARLFFFVLNYREVYPDGEIVSDILAACIFEYHCHASAVEDVYLKCGFVV